MSALGRHILVEFFGCTPEIMNQVSTIENSMVSAAETAGATVINSTFHHFSPYGVSGVVVIQESHLAIHTWPEYQYAAVDLFTCGDEVNPWKSFDYLKKAFEATSYSALEMRRGSVDQLERIEFDLTTMRTEAKERQNPKKYTRNVWFTDKDDNQGLSIRYTGEVLYEKQTEFQKVKVLETYAYGKMLTIDNMIMCTEKDETHYHEMISHPAMLAHGNIKNVLVIGGGDGGTIREVLKHESVEKVTMVEIDEAVIEASKLHLPQLSSAFGHKKLDLIIGDGIKYVADAKAGTYDLILVDGSDPVGPAKGLFTTKFYKDCHKALNDKGILVAQGESPMFNEKVFVELNQELKKVFDKDAVHCFTFSIPTYPTGIWSFQLATKGGLHPTKNFDADKAEKFAATHNLNYYNEGIHVGAFALPTFIKRKLNS